jgi:hypothetical protein
MGIRAEQGIAPEHQLLPRKLPVMAPINNISTSNTPTRT